MLSSRHGMTIAHISSYDYTQETVTRLGPFAFCHGGRRWFHRANPPEIYRQLAVSVGRDSQDFSESLDS